MSVDFDYDENLGNSAHNECLLSMETDNNFYVATSGALPWREPDDAPGDRMVVPGIFVESLLRKACAQAHAQPPSPDGPPPASIPLCAYRAAHLHYHWRGRPCPRLSGLP
mmetsp:Transcript_45444/g.112979  ORF Transcript_45444/g.112979 Transcript_45444/m.112979 type:complete len:110 (-) Transcript_45444:95-424(-)